MDAKPRSIDSKVSKPGWENDISLVLALSGMGLTLANPIVGMGLFSGGAAWHLYTTETGKDLFTNLYREVRCYFRKDTI